MKIKCYKNIIALSVLGFVVPPLHAETEADKSLDIEAITKKWKCKYCPEVEEPWHGELGFGIGYVTNDSFKHGEYTGLTDKSAYVSGSVDVFYRDDEAYYLNIEGDNLGLDSSFLHLEGGKQGVYKLRLEFDQINRYQLDSSRTPYSGGSNQTLPPGWTSAATTAGFATLQSSLHDVDISTERTKLVAGGEYIFSPHWSHGIEVRQQTKKGELPVAYSFGFNNSAIFAKPIDYTTDDLELNLNYRNSTLSAKFAYIHSTFDNGNDAFRWQNAYNAPAGATEGQAGEAPDNAKQQFMFSGTYSGIKDVQLTGLFSLSELTQDEAFLPYTVNSTLLTANQPRTSLDGKVQVINANIAAHWRYSDKQRWHFRYELHDQDNATARATYSYVNADNTITGNPRANFPYGFRRQNVKVHTDYKTDSKMNLSGGAQLATVERTYQSVDSSQENTLWAKIKDRLSSSFEYSVKAEYSDRSIDSYSPVNELVPAENPLMRKYNLADRTGQKLAFNLAYNASENLFFNFSADMAGYDYDGSQIGLKESDELTLGIDAQYVYSEDLSFNAFVTNTSIESVQAGSQSFSTPDWTATTDDNFTTVGLGFDYQLIEDKLKVGMNYSHASSTSAIQISNAAAPLPDLETKRDTYYLYGDYKLDKNLTIRGAYRYENFSEKNWSVDNVNEDTLAGVLTLGETAPDYSIGSFWVSLRYKF